ncbi:MAG: hypothetical protein ACR2Q4_00235 [Geminicoccaceae bacterium]
MIDTLFFALQIVGVAFVIGWALLNDRVPDNGRPKGPLAFKSSTIVKDGEAVSRPGRGRYSSLKKEAGAP